MNTRKQITVLKTSEAAAGRASVAGVPVVADEYWQPSHRPRRHNPWDALMHRRTACIQPASDCNR